jgi:Fic family protein
MLFSTPLLTTEDQWVSDHVDELRTRLRHQVAEPRRWLGLLRRVTLARNIQGSNSIEGYNVSLDDAVAVAERDEPLDANEETLRAVAGYREAMTYVLQLADDAYFEWEEALVRSLHYMMLSYDLGKSPGRWRVGPIFVQREETGEIVYDAPDAEDVPALMREFLGTLRVPTAGTNALVRAAMAHLNLVMIHPFRDGNGRMARCLQTLVLAREGILAPEFSSIEEYLGRNTDEYYKVLGEVGGGAWHPERDASAWIRFSLTAHYHQARTLLRRVQESEVRWERLETLVAQKQLPDRALPVLFNASMGFRVRNVTYRSAVEVSELVASRDLRSIVEAGLLEPQGEGRGRFYLRTQSLVEVDRAAREARSPRAVEDPYDLARQAVQPNLGLVG